MTSGKIVVKVKICGITNMEDARAAVEEGADALGFIFHPNSPRFISFQKAGEIARSLPPFVCTVGVFVNETEEKIHQAAKEASLSLVQLHGEEPPDFCRTLGLRVIKAIRISRPEDLLPIKTFPVQGVLLDSYHEGQYGGTGKTFNWEMLRGISPYFDKPFILSGGMTPENVREAIEKVIPYAVDVSSGVEERPGKKDRKKMKRFIQNAKGI